MQQRVPVLRTPIVQNDIYCRRMTERFKHSCACITCTYVKHESATHTDTEREAFSFYLVEEVMWELSERFYEMSSVSSPCAVHFNNTQMFRVSVSYSVSIYDAKIICVRIERTIETEEIATRQTNPLDKCPKLWGSSSFKENEKEEWKEARAMTWHSLFIVIVGTVAEKFIYDLDFVRGSQKKPRFMVTHSLCISGVLHKM